MAVASPLYGQIRDQHGHQPIIGRKANEQALDLPMNERELAAFQHSAQVLKERLAEVVTSREDSRRVSHSNIPCDASGVGIAAATGVGDSYWTGSLTALLDFRPPSRILGRARNRGIEANYS